MAFEELGFFDDFVVFCLTHSDELRHLLRIRRVQTNEVKRSALLATALAQIPISSKIALIDVGASTGLNLLLDRYSCRYSNGNELGDPDSPLVLECSLRGNPIPIRTLPKIAKRIGIDLHPIDLNDPHEALWTLSLVWPDQLERIARLRLATEILRQWPIELIRGDGLNRIDSVIQAIPKDLPVCIMHSFTLNQVSPDARESFDRTLRSLSNSREIWRISLEWLGTETPELALSNYSNGTRALQKTLARCHQHGEWIEWGYDADLNQKVGPTF